MFSAQQRNKWRRVLNAFVINHVLTDSFHQISYNHNIQNHIIKSNIIVQQCIMLNVSMQIVFSARITTTHVTLEYASAIALGI
jgi:hypothetical protein